MTFAPGQTRLTILVPILDDVLGEPVETFTLTLSNPVGGTIADGQGVATILDNETKFYVVNDASTDRTYEYGSSGASIEDYPLNSGNTAPRGAASNAAGTTVWVVDANKKVYVYNPSGGLLGSWTAGSLTASAQVEGIATNGTDVWIVDAKQDKVFRYTGAASRLSGSQNAASSFSLNSGNKNPKGIVTDGTSLWVVNDASANKVFKYTLTGTLLGSWTIDLANSSPTGITLDPTAPSHLWIVDNGTDRVYQYDNAVSRTSGSQTASLSFALAAGNTNPQGIADPPASDMLLTTVPALPPPPTAALPLTHPGADWGWIADPPSSASTLAAIPASQPRTGAPLPLAFPGVEWAWLVDAAPGSSRDVLTPVAAGHPNGRDLFSVPAGEMGPLGGPDLAEEGVREASVPAGPRKLLAGVSLSDELALLDQVFAGSPFPPEPAP